MKIVVHGEERYIPVSTVTLYNPDGATYPFKCTACCNTMSIIGGQVTKITPILEPSDQIPHVDSCRSCKAKYVFQDSYEPQETIQVVLFRTPVIQSFYCYLGGGDQKYINKILEYNNESVYSYTTSSSTPLPYTTACTNPSCHLTYQFTQLN